MFDERYVYLFETTGFFKSQVRIKERIEYEKIEKAGYGRAILEIRLQFKVRWHPDQLRKRYQFGVVKKWKEIENQKQSFIDFMHLLGFTDFDW